MLRLKRWLSANRHCYILLYLIFYLAAFVYLEKTVEPRYIIYSRLDALIPFCDWFVIPYYLWYPVLAASLFYYMVVSRDDFVKLCLVMFGGMTVCLWIYWMFPNGLNLRTEITGNHVMSRMVRVLHEVDTPTNVCPSIHVSSSVAIAIAGIKTARWRSRPWLRWGCVLVCALICVSTVFIKQHSIIDVGCGFLLSAALAVPVYRLTFRENAGVQVQREYIR